MCHRSSPVVALCPLTPSLELTIELVRAAGLHDERRAVRVERAAAIDAPFRFARAGVEIQQVRVGIVIADEDERVVEDRWRAAVAPVDVERRVLAAEMPRPDELAGHVERDDLARAEPRIDAPAVGDGAGRGEVVLVVHFASCPSAGSSYSQSLRPSTRLQRGDEERRPCRCVPRLPPPSARSPASDGVAALHERRMISGPPRAAPDLRCHEHLIAPHDRRRDAQAAHRRFPRDVFGVAPALWQAGLRGHAVRRRPSPVRPVVGAERRESDHQHHRNDAGFCHRNPSKLHFVTLVSDCTSCVKSALTTFSIRLCRNGNRL